jgi:hypothetical protein
MKNEITDTISRDEFSCATMGWNSECWKRKPPTEAAVQQGLLDAKDGAHTQERAAKDQQEVAQLATEKRTLDELEFALASKVRRGTIADRVDEPCSGQCHQ